MSTQRLCLASNRTFLDRKSKILEELNRPDDAYSDASPKGSVDAQIRDIVTSINELDHCVTTSSCAGRVALFAEGRRSSATSEQVEITNASSGGGKGGGGHWLYVSHDPVAISAETDLHSILNLAPKKQSRLSSPVDARLVHFKFEPFILHILVDSLDAAQLVLGAASQAGFRESGITAAKSACPMVAVRTMGLGFDSIVGLLRDDKTTARADAVVDDTYLYTLLNLANERFILNEQRRKRFVDLLVAAFDKEKHAADAWEDKDARRQRKRAEGLRQREAQASSLVRHDEMSREEREELPAHLIGDAHIG